MSDDEYPKKIDLLDAPLTVYREVNPPAGLETRILGTIEERLRRRRFTIRLLVAGTAAASIGLALLFVRTAPVSKHQPATATVAPQSPPVQVLPTPPPAPKKAKVNVLHVE